MEWSQAHKNGIPMRADSFIVQKGENGMEWFLGAVGTGSCWENL